LNITGSSATITNDILAIVKNDLQSTYLFRPVPEKAFMQKLANVKAEPQFSLWKIINAQYLLNAEVTIKDGRVYVIVALYDILSEVKVRTLSISGDLRDLRKIAHTVANNIYELVVGEKGYFDTKILYVALERRSNGTKLHRIAMMDQDGYNHRFLTTGKMTVLTPRFAPNGREFSFFSFVEKIVNGRRVPISANVYRYDLFTGATKLIVRMDGMTHAPRYSPDGRYLIFGLSRRGASSICRVNLISGEFKRLTRGVCIDTSPCYSPDGKYIVFNSDRGGSQQLYIMDADGSNIRRLSFSSGRYATPVWSPRGDWIAFTKFSRDGFYIGVVRPDGTGERMLASGYLVEGPTWSPNGRVLLYSSQARSRRERVYSVDITGYNNHELLTSSDAIDPDWGSSDL
jgi:TolB protein